MVLAADRLCRKCHQYPETVEHRPIWMHAQSWRRDFEAQRCIEMGSE